MIIARLLFVFIPLALLAFGVNLILKAANFWIATTGDPQTRDVLVYSSANNDFSVRAFYPEVINSKRSSLNVEIEVENKQGTAAFTDQMDVSVNENCEHLRLDTTLHTFDITSNAIVQSSESAIIARNNRPPALCEFEVKVSSDGKELGTSQFIIYINSWIGHAKSVANILFGLIIALGSLRGALAAIGI